MTRYPFNDQLWRGSPRTAMAHDGRVSVTRRDLRTSDRNPPATARAARTAAGRGIRREDRAVRTTAASARRGERRTDDTPRWAISSTG